MTHGVRWVALNIELIIAGFLLIAFLAAIISLKLKTPYTLILVLIGVAITATLTLLSIGETSLQGFALILSDQIRSFDNLLLEGGGSGLFVGIVVPPLVFESMMHIRGGELRTVIRPSLALATVGVVIATIVGGVVLWLMGLPFYVALLFAALIAPTDVVTILEVFRRVKVPQRLSIMLNTEATFNDATAIVVFTIILSSAALSQSSLLGATASFSFTLLGGLAIGLGVGFLAELLSSLIEDRVAECILTVSAVYGSFALATAIGASGIIAVAVTGLYFGNFTIRTAMESATKKTIMTFWEVIAFLANSIAFLFIGFQTDLFTLAQAVPLIIAAFVAVTIARAATVYPIFAFFSRQGEKIPRAWSNVALLGGVRGALSIVLAATITVSVVISATDVAVIRTMALGVAFLSITFQVPILFRYVRSRFKGQEPTKVLKVEDKMSDLSNSIKQAVDLKSDQIISDQEFVKDLEEGKEKIDAVIHEVPVMLETKEIIKERADMLYRFVTRSKNKTMRTTRKNED
jgi:CPA1 family monovalent cation:H+ antiporter